MDIDDEDFTPYCQTRGAHSAVAGMMRVHEEDLDSVARERRSFGGNVECADCDMVYRAGRGWVEQ